jgi:hypothetical protein
MRNEITFAFVATAAAAAAFAYAQTVTTRAFSMWSSPAVKHSNKRFTRWPSGVLN